MPPPARSHPRGGGSRVVVTGRKLVVRHRGRPVGNLVGVIRLRSPALAFGDVDPGRGASPPGRPQRHPAAPCQNNRAPGQQQRRHTQTDRQLWNPALPAWVECSVQSQSLGDSGTAAAQPGAARVAHRPEALASRRPASAACCAAPPPALPTAACPSESSIGAPTAACQRRRHRWARRTSERSARRCAGRTSAPAPRARAAPPSRPGADRCRFPAPGSESRAPGAASDRSWPRVARMRSSVTSAAPTGSGTAPTTPRCRTDR